MFDAAHIIANQPECTDETLRLHTACDVYIAHCVGVAGATQHTVHSVSISASPHTQTHGVNAIMHVICKIAHAQNSI